MSVSSLENGRKVTEICFPPEDFSNISVSPLIEGCQKEGLILEDSALQFGLDILCLEVKDRIKNGQVKEEVRIMLLVDESGWGFLVEADGLSPFGAFYRHGEVLPLFYGHIFF